MKNKVKDNKNIFRLKIFLIVSVLALVSFSPTFSAEEFKDYFKLVNGKFISGKELIISYELSEIIQSQISTDKGIFTLLEIPNSGYVGDIGRPQLPMQTRLYAVPDTQVSMKILDSNVLEYKDVGRIYPTQNLPTDGGINEEFEFDELFYQQDMYIPDDLVEIIDSGNIRDIPFVRIVFHPVQYNPKKEIAKIYDSITIQLTWNNKEHVMVENNFEQTPFYNLYQNTFTNWDSFFENVVIEQDPYPKSKQRDSGCEYLIVTHPDFYESAKNLSDWKHAIGWMTKLVNITDIGTSAEELRDYIQDAYDTWIPRPSYFLLIGDEEYVPANYLNIHPYDGSYTATDLWYATVNGTDYYPDLFHGRISVENAEQAEIIVQKIINYEQNPPSQPSFYNNMVVAAYFQDDEQNGYETRRFVRTSEEIRDYLLDQDYEVERVYVTEPYINPTHYNDDYYGDGEPLPEELLRPTFAWDGDADDIINAVEDGIFILNHRDHGATNGWGDPYFVSSHVEGLTNGELLPVVFSINCLTGEFDDYECFCEIFHRLEGGGAVAVFGATRVSFSGYNDFMARGFYDAQWPDFDEEIGDDSHLYTLGEILNYGKIYMANTWGDDWGYEELTFELFHIFGDPTMHIWTSLPQELTVEHIGVIPYGESIYEVNVKSGENPVEGALVCLSQPNGAYAKGITNYEGIAELELVVEFPDEVLLTVSAHNHLNFQTYVQVGSSYPPDRPTVNGPTAGKPGKDYEYIAVTTDPEEDQIFYRFDWGDGTQSEWLGPYDSGQQVTASNSWSELGNYCVKARAKDVNDSVGFWSEPYTVQIELPELKINRIAGGMLKITSTIENIGIAEADDITWKISLDGGFVLLGKESTGEIDTILAGDEAVITSKTILGFGPTEVTVQIDIPEDTKIRDQSGYIYLFYVHINPGGS